MRRTFQAVCVLGLALTLSLALVQPVRRVRDRIYRESLGHIGTLPGWVIQGSVLEFHGVAADLLFLKTISYIGRFIGEQQNLSSGEWRTTAHLLDRITDLDPRFWDPYVFAETMLAWQANMLDEADRLLQKAARARPTDYRPFYFLGFNEFYFRHNAAKAAPYLRRAAEKDNAPAYIKGLAARFSLYGGQTVMGILFLKNLLAHPLDTRTKKYLEKRLTALEAIHVLERAVARYRKQTGRLPSTLHDLVGAGLLDKLPVDPYGGDFVLLDNGRIFTTSQLIESMEKGRAKKPCSERGRNE